MRLCSGMQNILSEKYTQKSPGYNKKMNRRMEYRLRNVKSNHAGPGNKTMTQSKSGENHLQ